MRAEKYLLIKALRLWPEKAAQFYDAYAKGLERQLQSIRKIVK